MGSDVERIFSSSGVSCSICFVTWAPKPRIPPAMARPPTVTAIPNTCRREMPFCLCMVTPCSQEIASYEAYETASALSSLHGARGPWLRRYRVAMVSYGALYTLSCLSPNPAAPVHVLACLSRTHVACLSTSHFALFFLH